MADEELVKRLRGGDVMNGMTVDCKHDRCNCATMDEAADRIEELKRALQLVQTDGLHIKHARRADTAEAHLAKVLPLLKEARQDIEVYVTNEYPKDDHPYYERQWNRDMELCRRIDAVLAEIGGKP